MLRSPLHRRRAAFRAGPLVLLALVAGFGCRRGGGDAGPAEKVIAVVPKAMNSPFFDLARDGCKKAEAELAGVRCEYVGPSEATEAEQVQIVQDLISRGVDAIAVSPSNGPAMAGALERAHQAGIPVLTWDSDLLPQDHELRLAYIGTENRRIGIEQAKVLQRLKPDGGTLCIQSGGAAAQNHNERMQGIRDTLSGAASAAAPGDRLEGAGGWTEVDGCPLYTNDDLPLSVQQIADLLTRYPDLDALIVTGGFPQFVDQAYRQVMERYRERLESGETVVIVGDTLPMQMAILRDGLSHAQVGQRPFEMGYLAVKDLAAVLAGEPPPSDPTYTGLDVCLRDNADTCLGGGSKDEPGTGE